MPLLAIPKPQTEKLISIPIKNHRVATIDFLRGTVMIIMALDHVRDYFHADAFLYQPTDLSQTTAILFFTRWITHYCAPVFVFLAGLSAYLYGSNKNKRELSAYLLSRGIWLVFAELFLVTLGWTFNPTYPFLNLQVIWAIGISMIFLSAMIYMKPVSILVTGLILIGFHNLFDNVHLAGNLAWGLLHDPGDFAVGNLIISVHYPVIPWIGIMAVGYSFGKFYTRDYDSKRRRTVLLITGAGSILLFIILRSGNFYGDASYWSVQQSGVFSVLSFLNVTKYPPSLLYILMTIGPALIFLSIAEQRLPKMTSKVAVLGRVPFFYYVLHIYLIHLFAFFGASILGYSWSTMILHDRVNRVPYLKGYGYSLAIVYVIWIAVVLLLYPLCKWFDRYKRAHRVNRPWLSYV